MLPYLRQRRGAWIDPSRKKHQKGAVPLELTLVQLNGQTVGILQKGKSFASIGIYPNRLGANALRLELKDDGFELVYSKGQMPEATGFGLRGSRGWIGKREELQHILAV